MGRTQNPGPARSAALNPTFRRQPIGFNIEIKAKVRDFQGLEDRLAKMGACRVGVLNQVDEYFNCAQGRLKLRTEQGKGAELIFYRRDNAPGPKGSDYERVPIDRPQALAVFLEGALGRAGEVAKERTLYLLDQTRIHLDQVEGLGEFVELEVVLDSESEAKQGRKTAESIIAALGISRDDLVSGSYIDLLMDNGN